MFPPLDLEDRPPGLFWQTGVPPVQRHAGSRQRDSSPNESEVLHEYGLLRWNGRSAPVAENNAALPPKINIARGAPDPPFSRRIPINCVRPRHIDYPGE